jgi:hypothetical protein
LLSEINRLEAETSYQRLNSAMQKVNYHGPDPYDALTSPAAMLLGSKLSRQGWLQLHARSPAGLRRVTGVRPLLMTKTQALVAEAYALRGDQSTASALGRQILANRHTHGLWGYEFDVQTRWAHYCARTPNVIVTAFVVRALDAAGLLANGDLRGSLGELVVGEFVHGDGWVRYLRESPTLIHNANTLGAATLARLGLDGSAVMAVLEPTLLAQNHDGSWRYGQGSSLGWVDNFHTAYVLSALSDISAMMPDLKTQLAQPLSRGTTFWLSRMFSDDGTPLYFPDSPKKSSDVHNTATAVWALAQLDDCPADLFSESLHALLLKQGSDGQFRSHPLAPRYMRWNNAHALLALAKSLS